MSSHTEKKLECREYVEKQDSIQMSRICQEILRPYSLRMSKICRVNFIQI